MLVVVGAAVAVGLVAAGRDGGEPVGSQSSGAPVASANAEAAAGSAGTTRRAADEAAGDAAAWDRRDSAHWPLQGQAARATRVPILMYHLIAQAPAGVAYPDLWVPEGEFAAHVRALADAGFTGVTLGEVWDAWHGDGRLPRRPVVLSFDDGSYSHVLAAAPLLLKQGWPGVLNLTTANIGDDGIPNWGVKRLLRQGWAIDSHTATHPDVTTLDAAGNARELAGSRAEIRRRFGVTPRFFCYPAGRNDAAARAAVRAAGYEAATTTEPGLARRSGDPFGLPRVRIDPGLSGASVVRLARGVAA